MLGRECEAHILNSMYVQNVGIVFLGRKFLILTHKSIRWSYLSNEKYIITKNASSVLMLEVA